MSPTKFCLCFRSIISYFFAAICILIITLFAITPFACTSTGEGIQIVCGDYEAPKITSFSVTGLSTVEMCLSEPGSLINTVLSEEKNGTSKKTVPVSAVYNPTGKMISILFPCSTEIGKRYELTGSVKDTGGSTLTFSIPFSGFNSNPARLLLSEIRSERSGNKVEYVELYVLKSGNTAGLELVSASDGENNKYCFPPIEVNAGEYITVHGRTLEGSRCVDETGSDYTLSSTIDSCNSARDLWVSGTSPCIGKSDIVFIQNNANGSILDAVLYAQSEKESWSEKLQPFADRVASSGVWKGGSSIENAVCCDGVTPTRTLSRRILNDMPNQISSDNSDWFVTVTGSASPGRKNSTAKYIARK